MPDDVLEFIASKISSNIRELEGALIRVTAFASLNRQAVDLALAETVLKDLITRQQGAGDHRGHDHGQHGGLLQALASTTSAARRAAERWSPPARSRCTCAGSSPTCRCPRSASMFGGRDHTTVMHADRKIRELMAERRAIYNQVTELTNRIKQQAR